MFFIHRALSIANCPFTDDLTVQYLYTLAISNEEDQNILLPLLESQNREHERLLSLANTVGTPDVLIQAINDAKSRNDELKRKNDSDLAGSLSNRKTTAASTNASSSSNNNNDLYEQGMDFVEHFKQARIQKGLKKMDWIVFLKEGKQLGLLNYKNADALRNQFSKFTKRKSRNHENTYNSK